MTYSYSTNQESYFGDFATREQALAEAINEAREYGHKKVWIGQSVPPTQPEDLWVAEDWLELVSCQDDYCLDCASDWDESTNAQREELESAVRTVMAEWLDRHKLRPKFFLVDNVEEIDVQPGEIGSDGQ